MLPRQAHFGLPLAASLLGSVAYGLAEAGKLRLGLGKVQQRFPFAGLQISSQDMSRGCVVGAQVVSLVERQHTRRQVCQHSLEVSALHLGFRAGACDLFLCIVDLPGHVVERLDEHTEFVFSGHRELLAIVALRDRTRPGRQVSHRRDQPPGREDRGRHRDQHREQRHQTKRQGETELQRATQVHQLLVFGEGRLYALAKLCIACGQRLQQLQDAHWGTDLTPVHGHHDA